MKNEEPKNFSRQVNLSGVELEDWKKKRMYVQGYRFVGRHSAIKVCTWTKKGIRGTGMCYKNKFYGINSAQCIQMSPAAFFCDFNCLHCWRSLNFNLPKENFKWDSPEEIFKGCINAHKRAIMGFWGHRKFTKEKDREIRNPKHFAISLSGEATLYPFLPEFIELIKNKEMTAFLVTNGAHPEMIKKLIGKSEPTNLYVTLPAPDELTYKKECCPRIPDGWEKIHETLSLLKGFSCDTVIRLTLSKKTNFINPQRYAEIIEKYKPKYLECKSYMAVGGAREKMGYKEMPLFSEMLEFAKEISNNSSYKIVNFKEDSRVVLLSRSD
jgi:tRNA wybutosine-synthesizing protein 1